MASAVRRRVVRLLVVVSVARPKIRWAAVALVVRLRAVLEWVVRLRAVVSVVRRRIKVVLVVVVLVNNNSRWEWEELQCKVVREWVRVWRRVECSRTAVRQAVVR